MKQGYFEKFKELSRDLLVIWNGDLFRKKEHGLYGFSLNVKAGKSSMNQLARTKKKAVIALTIIAIIAISSLMFLEKSQTTQAAILSPIPPSGLVGWWRFDEGSGTLAGDSSGNGNTGTIFGCSWVSGKYGDALSFDGLTSYVDGGNNLVFNSNTFSIALWFKTTTVAPSFQSIFTKSGVASDFDLQIEGSTLKFYISQSTNLAISYSTPIVINTWYHVVISDGGTGANNLKMYVNGVEVASESPTGSRATNSNNVQIGKSAVWGGRYFNGVIDEVRFFNRALSAAEIQTDYQNGPSFASQLTAKIPKGTTQVIATVTWQGAGSVNATITSPSQTYTEDAISVYQKTTYSTTSDTSGMLNIKRLSISVTAVPVDQSWIISLTFDNVAAYQIAVEVQK